MLFMCWTRETGVIPAALAGLLLGIKRAGRAIIASVTFVAILMTILIQAPTTEWLGRRLRLMVAKDPHSKPQPFGLSSSGPTSYYCCVATRALGSAELGRRHA